MRKYKKKMNKNRRKSINKILSRRLDLLAFRAAGTKIGKKNIKNI